MAFGEKKMENKNIRYALGILDEPDYRTGRIIFVGEDENEVLKKEKELLEEKPECAVVVLRSNETTTSF